jgi:hypothetical protein
MPNAMERPLLREVLFPGQDGPLEHSVDVKTRQCVHFVLGMVPMNRKCLCDKITGSLQDYDSHNTHLSGLRHDVPRDRLSVLADLHFVCMCIFAFCPDPNLCRT